MLFLFSNSALFPGFNDELIVQYMVKTCSKYHNMIIIVHLGLHKVFGSLSFLNICYIKLLECYLFMENNKYHIKP